AGCTQDHPPASSDRASRRRTGCAPLAPERAHIAASAQDRGYELFKSGRGSPTGACSTLPDQSALPDRTRGNVARLLQAVIFHAVVHGAVQHDTTCMAEYELEAMTMSVKNTTPTLPNAAAHELMLDSPRQSASLADGRQQGVGCSRSVRLKGAVRSAKGWHRA